MKTYSELAVLIIIPTLYSHFLISFTSHYFAVMSADSGENRKEEPSTCESDCNSLPSYDSTRERFFLVDSEHHQGIAIVNEDTLVYGKDDRDHPKGMRIVASKSGKRFTAVYSIEDDGTEFSVQFDQDTATILNLNDEGERWEGSILDRMPFGWGKRFDEDGALMYEGFSVNDKYCLYGREYYPDVGTVRYEGNWCDGMRCGRGVLFDKRGQKVYEGEWVNDTNAIEKELVVTDPSLLPPFTSLLELLTVGENCCNANESLLLNDLPRLKVVSIGSNSFGAENQELLFSCVNCPELVSITLGDTVVKGFTRIRIQGLVWQIE